MKNKFKRLCDLSVDQIDIERVTNPNLQNILKKTQHIISVFNDHNDSLHYKGHTDVVGGGTLNIHTDYEYRSKHIDQPCQEE